MSRRTGKTRKRRPPTHQSFREKLGAGIELIVTKFRAPKGRGLRESMDEARGLADRGLLVGASTLVYDVWRRGRGEKFVEVWAGQMLAKYGEPAKAVEVFCDSEGLRPGAWEAYWQLGHFLLLGGLDARAELFLKEAIRLQPLAVDAHDDLVHCLTRLGRGAEAKEHAAEVRRLGGAEW